MGTRSSQDGRATEEEVCAQKVHIPWHRTRGAARQIGNGTDGAVQRTSAPSLSRGLNIKVRNFIRKLRKAKTACPYGEKPEVVKTHLRNQIVMPEMVGSVAGVYNGKAFNSVEIKPEMIGHYLGEFSITYHPVRHGRPGIGATNSSRFIPLK